MKTQQKHTLFTILSTLVLLLNFTNGQITWSYWKESSIFYFGSEHASASAAGSSQMFLAGGSSSIGDSYNLWRFQYSPSTDSSSNMNVAWSGGCAVYDSATGLGYFFGGVMDNGTVMTTVSTTFVSSNEQGLSFDVPNNIVLGEGVRCVMDHARTVHIFGGLQNSTLHVTYSVPLNSWNVMKGMPEGKSYHGAAMLSDNLIYVFGGINEADTVTDSVFAYNLTAQTWSPKPAMPQINAAFASSVTNDHTRVYVVGGSNDPNRTALGAVYDSVWYYSPNSGNWTVDTSFPYPVKGIVAVIADSTIYTIGGRLANGTITGARMKGTIIGLPSPSATPSVTPSPSASASASATPSASPSFGSSPSASPAPNYGTNNKKDNTGLAVGLGLGIPLGFIAILLAAFVIYRIQKQKNTEQEMKTAPSNDPEAGTAVVAKPESRATDINADYSGRWFINYKEIERVKELGKGAFGVVYLCKWRNSDCVVKQLNMEKSDENSVKEFLREADNMRNMKSHPNICWIYGVCANPENPICIVMEYLPEGSLFDLIFVKGQQVTALTAIQIGKDVASGMAHLHAENLLHCDLACRNLLVASKGHGKFTVKIADFGLSRTTETGIYNAKEDKKFPIRWSAPEVLRAGTVSKCSDVWSFGIVMWEMIESQRPYTELSNEEVIRMVCQKGYRLSKPSRIEIPEDMWNLLQSCWDATPASRPTFGDIYASLCLIEKNYLADHGSEQNSDDEFSFAKSEHTSVNKGTLDYARWNEEQQPISQRPSSHATVGPQPEEEVHETYNTINSNTNSKREDETVISNNNNNNNNNSSQKPVNKEPQYSHIAQLQDEEIYNNKKKNSSSDYGARMSKKLTPAQLNDIQEDGYAPVSLTSDNN